ncbi:AzlD domain-containing protein [Parvibacter caecicola]|uniref:AzlD domain-containing protein n=1 Tax=Parvibacter caecicola TaxID=747645 RepID=A0A3N0AD10_9ACTN|nr:AzlD domain-containing protein [Parvibacter caecicola]MBB3170444.1 branched-subunit amino acid transport protein [Parvibacter caecicola]MCR2041592.1 AzlD domain-containing protein [Parvibacter caecicola]RNL12160.1 branched-chain amino acid transporter [Parvibacter caecicola]TJW12328.1 AzlD domain-containing protein [Parvibacter caecicola]
MSWTEFWIVFGCCAVTMLACRVLPLFLLKGRELPDGLNRALGFIPPAAFAALVANDLVKPGMFADGLWPAAAPFAAAVCVVAVALKTKSLLWSALAGVAAFALLLAIGS